MPGNPKECRRQAYECVNTWLRLAVNFEEDDAVLSRCGDNKSNVIPLNSRRHRPIRLKAS